MMSIVWLALLIILLCALVAAVASTGSVFLLSAVVLGLVVGLFLADR